MYSSSRGPGSGSRTRPAENPDSFRVPPATKPQAVSRVEKDQPDQELLVHRSDKSAGLREPKEARKVNYSDACQPFSKKRRHQYWHIWSTLKIVFAK